MDTKDSEVGDPEPTVENPEVRETNQQTANKAEENLEEETDEALDDADTFYYAQEDSDSNTEDSEVDSDLDTEDSEVNDSEPTIENPEVRETNQQTTDTKQKKIWKTRQMRFWKTKRS